VLKNFSFAAALSGFSMLLLSTAAQAEWVKVEPPGEGFSVFFPATPTYESQPGGRTWIVRAGNLLCLFVVTDYNLHVDADNELELDVRNFLKELNGSLQSQERLSFRAAPDGPLPAVKFSFAIKNGAGQSLIVVSGDRVYNAAAVAVDGADRKDVSRCVDFKITAPSRHWQGH
jgi:hypothetical protein